MKYFFALSILLFSFTGAVEAYARTSKEASIEQAGNFQATGTYCANPWDGNEGPNYEAAQRQADQTAMRQCYPFQARRTSNYQNGTFDKCPQYFWGSQAAAIYSCAG
jgi:hypothetical protein